MVTGEGRIIGSVEKCGEMCWGVGGGQGDLGRGGGCGKVYGVSVEKCVEGVGQVKRDAGKCGGGVGKSVGVRGSLGEVLGEV